METASILRQARFFLFNHIGQFGADDWIVTDHFLIQHHDSPFGKRADRKFTMERVPNLAHDEHIQRKVKDIRHLGRDHYPATRQSQYQVSPNRLFLQSATQFPASIFSRSKHNVTIRAVGEKINGLKTCHNQVVTSVPTFSPSTTRLRLCGRKKSKTIIGILLSMQSEKAVESITFNRLRKAS